MLTRLIRNFIFKINKRTNSKVNEPMIINFLRSTFGSHDDKRYFSNWRTVTLSPGVCLFFITYSRSDETRFDICRVYYIYSVSQSH